MDSTKQLRNTGRGNKRFGQAPVFCAIGLLPLVSLIDTSFELGPTADTVLRWEALVRWMETALVLFRNGAILIAFCWIAILLPMYAIRRLRPTVASALMFSSFLMGAMCWWYSFIVTFRMLGWLFVCIGVLCGGLGVVPMAIYAAAVKGDGVAFISLTGALALTLIPRAIAKSIKTRIVMRRDAARAKAGYWVAGEQYKEL